MKNKALIVLLAVFVGDISASIDGDQLAIALAEHGAELYATHQQYQQSLPNERNYRKKLYWLDKNHPNWFLLADFQKDFDYYIANVANHIKVLEYKLAQKKNGLKSFAMIRGTITAALSILSGYGAKVAICQCRNGNTSQDMMNVSVGLSLGAGVFGLLAVQELDKAYRYAERMIERLERDKRILAILEREKATKNNGVAVVTNAAHRLIGSIVDVVTSFSQPASAPVAVNNGVPTV